MAIDRRPPELRVSPNRDVLSQELASDVAHAVQAATGCPFWIALTGGRSSRLVYDVLGRDYPADLWANVHYCWSDERLVSRDDSASNYHSAWETWLGPAHVSLDRLHAPEVWLPDVTTVASRYERDIRQLLGPRLALDCVLLSLGEDGHVASLFPGRTEAQEESRLVVPVVDSPKPPPRRVTMTLALINRALTVHVLAVGPDKAEALRSTLVETHAGLSNDPHPPAAGLLSSSGRVLWWADEAAARLLPSRVRDHVHGS